MTTLYKLTDEKYRTHGNTQWGEGVSHSGTGEGGLCGPGWIHAYTHPLLAVLLNPIHGGLKTPVLWEAEGEVALTDHGLKVGCRTLTTTHIIALPELTTEHRVTFAILCALEVCHEPGFVAWATGWLAGTDRSKAAAAEAASAATAARAAEAAAVWAAEAAEARAAEWAAARAADAAADRLDLIALAERAMAA